MEEFKPKILEWQQRLADWQLRFDDAYAAAARARGGLFGKLSDGERAELAAAACRSAGEDVAVELRAFLVALCDAYLAEKLPAQRAKVRAWIGRTGETLNAIWNFAEQSIGELRDEAALRRALAALSIHDLRGDFTAVQEQLGRAWVAARKAGLDPAPHFAAVAALSNPGMGGGGSCFGAELAGFAAGSYFRDRIRPQLGRASA